MKTALTISIFLFLLPSVGFSQAGKVKIGGQFGVNTAIANFYSWDPFYEDEIGSVRPFYRASSSGYFNLFAEKCMLPWLDLRLGLEVHSVAFQSSARPRIAVGFRAPPLFFRSAQQRVGINLGLKVTPFQNFFVVVGAQASHVFAMTRYSAWDTAEDDGIDLRVFSWSPGYGILQPKNISGNITMGYKIADLPYGSLSVTIFGSHDLYWTLPYREMINYRIVRVGAGLEILSF